MEVGWQGRGCDIGGRVIGKRDGTRLRAREVRVAVCSGGGVPAPRLPARSPHAWPAGCSTATKASRSTSRAERALDAFLGELRRSAACGDHHGGRGRTGAVEGSTIRHSLEHAREDHVQSRRILCLRLSASRSVRSSRCRASYPYINCTDAAPATRSCRPAVRPRQTTMDAWAMDLTARREYHDAAAGVPRAAGGMSVCGPPYLLRCRWRPAAGRDTIRSPRREAAAGARSSP